MASLSESGSQSDEDGPVYSPPYKKPKLAGASSVAGVGVVSQLSDSEDEEDAMDKPGSSVAKDFLRPASKQAPNYSNFANKMMAKMGYKEGSGLGRHGQGRVEIVEASKQKGKRGLGMRVKNFEASDVQWDAEKEEVHVDETVEWMVSGIEEVPSLEDMRPWIAEGKRKMDITGETLFVSEQTLQDVISCKTVFDDLEGEEMRQARTRSNPYESIRGVFFLNRAAMKMANMDAVLDFMFTNPKDEDGRALVAGNDLLYFADVCAGPGGFSEYVLWRRKYDVKGFGFTLRGNNDFKLEDFYAAPSELFEPHYGVKGVDGDGDVYKPDNLREFRKFVMESTDGRGVHFVMADGGFSVEGQENLQEVLSKRLYLCQALCAMSILRTDGHFVCKLFDIFTLFSIGLIYLMYRAFKQVSIFKPVTSRPANSERYIVCKWKLPETENVHDYMFEVNERFEEIWGPSSEKDINQIVPLEVIKADEKFYNYIVESNETLGNKQSIALAKIQAFAQNTTLHEMRQSSVRQQCLENWEIPDEVRTDPNKSENPYKKFQKLIQDNNLAWLNCTPKVLDVPDSLLAMKSAFDYRCYVSGATERWYVFSPWKSTVFKWNGKPNSKWVRVEDVVLELPRDTVLEVEFVQTFKGEGKGQRRVMSVHVIDGLFLCGDDIRDLHFNERHEKMKKFLKAIHRPTRSNLAPIKIKDIFKLELIDQIFDKLTMKIMKGNSGMHRLCYTTESGDTFLPAGLTFIKTTQEPWMMAFSKSQNRKYFFNTKNGQSVMSTPKDAVANYRSCLESRLAWAWGPGVQVIEFQPSADPNKISKHTISGYVKKLLHR